MAGAEVAVEPRLRTDREVAQRPGPAHLGVCVALRQPASHEAVFGAVGRLVARGVEGPRRGGDKAVQPGELALQRFD